MSTLVNVDEILLNAAAERLVRGRLVAFPTETVYGLGANAADPVAVARIFAAKGRPSDHPLIVHVTGASDAWQWTSELAPVAQRLIDRFWPGPLTLVLPRRAGLGAAAAGGQDSIGLRCPSHPVAQALLARLAQSMPGPGIAAPSANRFGRISPTCARHVLDEFGAAASVTDSEAPIQVLDGGDCAVGIESTIVDCSRLATIGPVLLRPGAVTAAMLAEVLGAEPASADRDAPRASGTLAAHYAPETPLRLVDAADLANAPRDVVAYLHATSIPVERDDWLRAPADALRYAHELYAALRRLDARRARAIWIEQPPATAEWTGINDRLQRAAAR